MPRWWRKRSSAARFDLYMRMSCYLNYAAIPPLLAFGIANQTGAVAAWVIAVLASVFAFVCVQLIRHNIDHYLGRGARPVRLLAATTMLTVVAVVAGFAVYPLPAPGHADGPGNSIALWAVIMSVAAVATAVRRWTAVVLWALGSATLAAKAPSAQYAITFALVLAFMVVTYRVSLWMLGMFWELDRARRMEGQFAVAEERLRFARDLHDVVGRNLSVVALKAELAARLAKRGREEAADEMLEVRRIAEDSLAELRAVVGGYRSADLAAELAGARSLLTSAGIDCRVVGDGGGLPEQVQGTLGWAVREGTTNVLRHSEARACTITLRPADDAVTLTMENDGTAGEARVRSGNGLIGLAERIAGLGGSVAAERERPDRFRLTVSLPLAEETP